MIASLGANVAKTDKKLEWFIHGVTLYVTHARYVSCNRAGFDSLPVAELTDEVPHLESDVKLLAIDTATEACSAALQLNDRIITRHQIAPRQHANLILTMVDELLAEAELAPDSLDALVFGRGPGAFTGVRIAAGVIQGLAFGFGLPVIPVSTLAALAQPAADRHTDIISAIDARMGEIYTCTYRTGVGKIVAAVSEEQVCKPDQLTVDPDRHYFGIGTGWQTYAAILTERCGGRVTAYEGERYPDARYMLPIAEEEFRSGRMVSAAEALPVYLRNKVTG